MGARLDDLRLAVVDQLGLLEVDHMLNDATLNRAVNAGLRRMTREMDWPWLISYATVNMLSGTGSYDLPDNIVRIRTVRIGNNKLSPTDMDDMVENVEEVGFPSMYTVENPDAITILPSPNVDGSIRISYIRREPKLVNDEDETLAPEDYDDIIVLYAAIYQATRMRDLQLANALRADKDEQIKVIRKDVLKTTRVPAIKTRDDF